MNLLFFSVTGLSGYIYWPKEKLSLERYYLVPPGDNSALYCWLRINLYFRRRPYPYISNGLIYLL